MAARVAPTLQAGNALALAYTCWKSDNSWAGQWGVLLCLKDPKGMNMSTVRKRRTCFYLLPFCLPFWAVFMTLSFKTVLNILTWVPSHVKSKESDDCVHWIVHVWNMLNLRSIQPQSAERRCDDVLGGVLKKFVLSRPADTCRTLAIGLNLLNPSPKLRTSISTKKTLESYQRPTSILLSSPT